MQDFRNLKVWEKAHSLTLRVYEVTRPFPESEKYGLVSQLRRAASSVPANIAEGCGRTGDELIRFLRIGMGSANELEYHLLLSHDLALLSDPDYAAAHSDVVEVKRMLASLIVSLQRRSRRPQDPEPHQQADRLND